MAEQPKYKGDTNLAHQFLKQLFDFSCNSEIDTKKMNISFLEKWHTLEQEKGTVQHSRKITKSFNVVKDILNSPDRSIFEFLDLSHNIYVGGATFIGATPSSAYLKTINELYIDIDAHDEMGAIPYPDVLEILDFCNDTLFGKTVPMPSYAIYTGRGLHLHWFIEPIKDSQLTYWKKLQAAIHGEFLKHWLDHKHYTYNTEIDSNKDVGRRLRLLGTYNTVANTSTRLIAKYSNQKQYTLDQISQTYFPVYAKPPKSKKSDTEKEVPLSSLNQAISGKENTRRYNLSRMKDLEKLQVLRGEQFGPCRELACYFYWQHALLVEQGDFEKAKQLALAYNESFKVPLTTSEILKEASSAETWWKKTKYPKPPLNITLIQKLYITEQELEQLKAISLTKQTKEEKNKKLRESYRGKQGLTPGQQKRCKLVKDIQHFKALAWKQADIATELQCSLRTIQTYWTITPEMYVAQIRKGGAGE